MHYHGVVSICNSCCNGLIPDKRMCHVKGKEMLSSGKTQVLLLGITGLLGVLIVVLFFIAPGPSHTMGFESIDEVMADAEAKEELAAPESYKDHRRPSWKTYHTKTQPGYFSKRITSLLSLMGLGGCSKWSASYFVHLLDKRIKEREAMGLSSKYEYVYRLAPTTNSRIIVWGDMSGAYHSLARGLKKLISLDIMDNKLQLKNKDDYIAFMGDVASRSPFIMEVLTLIMKLEERNPGRIVYMTGNNERRGSWYPYGLREEIGFKASRFTSKKDPLYKKVEHYFETLPLGIYMSVPPHTNKDFVRLSHFAMETPSKETYRVFVDLLNDSFYSDELEEEIYEKTSGFEVLPPHRT